MARRRAMVFTDSSSYAGSYIFKLIRGLSVLFVALAVVLGGAAAYLTYRVLTRHNTTETVTPQSYLLSNYVSLPFNDKNGGEHEGWLLLGLKGAPAIILCHGYDSNRSDLLSLGTILRDNHFNVYVFNFSGPKTGERFSNLGPRQASDVLAAIDNVTKQQGVNPNRVGLYGITLGGYAAMVAAQQNPKVKALAVDTVYARPDQLFDYQIDRRLGGSSPIFRLITGAEFHLFTLWRPPYPLEENLPKLQGMPKLFISSRDVPPLAQVTEGLYTQAPQPKRLLVMEHSQASMTSGTEKKEYENQVLNFFLQNLSLRAD